MLPARPMLLLVDCPEEIGLWPIAEGVELKWAEDWGQATEMLRDCAYDALVAGGQRKSNDQTGLCVPHISFANFQRLKNLRNRGLLNSWLAALKENLQLELQLQDNEFRLHQINQSLPGILDARQQLFEIFDRCPTGNILVSRKGTILRANRRAGLIFGRPPKELEGAPLTFFLERKDVSTVLRFFWECARGEQLRPWKLRLRSPDARCREVMVSGQGADQGQEKVIHLFLHELGLDNQPAEQAQLLEAEVSEILDCLEDGYLWTDQVGGVQYSNRSAQELFGREQTEMVGLSLSDLGIHLEQSPGPETGWCQKADGQPFLAEFSLIHQRGWGLARNFICVRDLSPLRRARNELLEIRERELASLGQELHDDLGQLLTAISYLAELLVDKIQANPPIKSLAQQIAELARDSIKKTRSLARSLYPEVLDRNGLAEALRELAVTVEESFPICCQVRVSRLKLDRGLSLHFFRIAQEALMNAVGHASASRVEIEVEADSRRIWMIISDNGQGSLETEDRGGPELLNMRQHAETLGGGVRIESSPGQGNRIICWAPRPL
ncbi:MAG: PAS domain-containing protein [Vulcanimicrobiota bacterium]